jgi:fructosamine-3-kinase
VTGQEPALPDVAARLGRLTGTEVREIRRLGGQHEWGHYRVVLADGRLVFAKAAGADLGAGRDGLFEAEARGMRWLADAGAVPVPDVLGWDSRALAVCWLTGEPPAAAAAERFGRDLARMHLAGSARFGAPWPGFIASLPLGNGAGPDAGRGGGPDAVDSWPQWYARERLLPYARRAFDAGDLAAADLRLLETVASRAGALAGPAEPPSRIHGDCWSGNLLWSGGRGWLVDPAAHGGHRESDLAMLALFGAPYLERIMAAYQEIAPLAAGWRARVPLHQLHPLLVHACLFGAAYRDAALGAARSALAAG